MRFASAVGGKRPDKSSNCRSLYHKLHMLIFRLRGIIAQLMATFSCPLYADSVNCTRVTAPKREAGVGCARSALCSS